MDPDVTVKQAGRSWDEMAMPCLYVALDVGKSTVTYLEGPVFRLQPGSLAVLKVKSK
jgi:hypothetical protein